MKSLALVWLQVCLAFWAGVLVSTLLSGRIDGQGLGLATMASGQLVSTQAPAPSLRDIQKGVLQTQSSPGEAQF